MFNPANLFGNVITGFTAFGHDILVPALFTVALIAFLYGLFNYFIFGSGDEDKKEQGRRQLLCGNVGFVVGVSVWTVFQSIIWLQGTELPTVGPERGTDVQVIPNTPLR